MASANMDDFYTFDFVMLSVYDVHILFGLIKNRNIKYLGIITLYFDDERGLFLLFSPNSKSRVESFI